MIYSWSISTPANTAEADKQKTILPLGSGVIHQLDILFPPGPAGLLHLQINDAIHQVWPTNPEESFAADGDMITFREYHELLEEPYELQAWTWNEDDTYDHTVLIRIGLLRRRFVLRRLI